MDRRGINTDLLPLDFFLQRTERHTSQIVGQEKQKTPPKVRLLPLINVLTTFSGSPLLTACIFAKPLPTVHPRAFPPSPFQFHGKERSDGNSLVAEHSVSRREERTMRLTPLGARGRRLWLSVRRREDARTRGRPGTPAAAPAPPAKAPSPARPRRRLPTARAPSWAHARGAPGRAGHTPPTHSESLSLPALAPSPSGVSQSLPVAAGSLCFPLPTRSAAVVQAFRGVGDRERERLT